MLEEIFIIYMMTPVYWNTIAPSCNNNCFNMWMIWITNCILIELHFLVLEFDTCNVHMLCRAHLSLHWVIHFVFSKVNVNKTQNIFFSWYFVFIVNFEHWHYVWKHYIILMTSKQGVASIDSFEVIFEHFLIHIGWYLSHNLTNVGF